MPTDSAIEMTLAALWAASYTCVGPEYISMVAAEGKHPRIYIKQAFKTAYRRFGVFFVGGALACGILIAYNDKALVAINSGQSGSAGASPYVIAVSNLGVNVLPRIVNALLVTTIFSAGNTYTFCATCSLYGLACDSKAPRVLRKCTKNGVPVYCVAIVVLFPFLSFLSLSSSSSQVLNWLVDVMTAAAIIDYIVMCGTFVAFYRACHAQSLDRAGFPYTGWFQPWSAWIGMGWMILIVIFHGYECFVPWSAVGFFAHSTMHIFAVVTFMGWKLLKRTKFLRPDEVDLVCRTPEITEDEAGVTMDDQPVAFWTDVAQYFGSVRGRHQRQTLESTV